MKKTVLSFILLSFLAAGAKAQSSDQPFAFSAGVAPALPLGDFGKTHSFGIGAQLQGEYWLSEFITGVVTTGYSYYFGKSQTTSVTDPFTGQVYSSSFKNPSVGHIPILVGARVLPTEQFFVGAQIGYGIFTGGQGGSLKGFEYRPQVGYNAGQLQFNLYYDGTSVTGGTLSQLGLGILYKFDSGK